MGFTNITNAISANHDEEEIWLELHSYRDHKHQEEVGTIMQRDESAATSTIVLRHNKPKNFIFFTLMMTMTTWIKKFAAEIGKLYREICHHVVSIIDLILIILIKIKLDECFVQG
jgi:hypothetical protein